MKLLKKYLRPYIGRMSLGISIKFFGSLMDLLLPWILAYIIDTIIPTKNVSAIFLWGGVMLLCSVIAVVTNILANRMRTRIWREELDHPTVEALLLLPAKRQRLPVEFNRFVIVDHGRFGSSRMIAGAVESEKPERKHDADVTVCRTHAEQTIESTKVTPINSTGRFPRHQQSSGYCQSGRGQQ